MAERPTRILLVDDEQAILTLLSYPLAQDGYEVVRASDGVEALERFGEADFDLVVLDVMLPQHRRARGVPAAARDQLGPDHHADREVRGDRQGRSASSSGPTTTSPSRSRCASSAAASRRRCGARRSTPAGRGPARRRRGAAEAGELRIDFPKRTVRVRDEPVQTTFVEFEILGVLARSPGRVFTRDSPARPHLGRLRLPRPAHDRCPHPPPAREDRA